MSDILYFWLGFITGCLVIIFVMFMTSCSGNYEKGWAWGVVTPEGEVETAKFLWGTTEVRIEDMSSIDEHKACRDKHYIDPYSKLEYCLPDNFEDIRQLHHYRVSPLINTRIVYRCIIY